MRILIVEDEKNLAESLKQMITAQKFQADTVYDGEDGLEYARSGQYDAMILDVMLPKLNGFQIVKTLRKEGNAIPVLMLTARDDTEDKVRGLDSGADDYLTKPFTTEELLARVRALTRRQGTVQMAEMSFGDITLLLSSSSLTKGDKQVRLSQKELEVLKLLMARAGAIVSKNDLIARVWGLDSEAMDNNVEAYISFLRKKLFYLGSVVQIVSQRKMGYFLEETL